MNKVDKEVDISLLREDIPEEGDESGLFENAPKTENRYIITDKVRGV
ncbi:MAG: hypothetical protein IIV97_05035 [Oscillospiraceae bacterium]|nr:hypothetical protein [Oscillospiraceae bacterium]